MLSLRSNRSSEQEELLTLRREVDELRKNRICSVCKTRTYQIERQPHQGVVLGAPQVTVCVPSLPERKGSIRERAIRSIRGQMLRAADIYIEIDREYKGSDHVRRVVLHRVETPYVAFVDDDDQLHENHLFLLMDLMLKTGADLTYSCHIDCPTPMEDECMSCRSRVPLLRTHMFGDSGMRRQKLQLRTWIKHTHDGQTGGKL